MVRFRLGFKAIVCVIIVAGLIGCDGSMTKKYYKDDHSVGDQNVIFNCKEVDYAPKITEEADKLYKEARVLVSQKGEKNQRYITELYQQAAEKGHWKAEYHLARRYALGNDIDRDEKESREIIDSMVARDIPLGYYALAMIKDREVNLKKAAERGNPQAQYILGEEAYMIYDVNLAKKYYHCAAEQGMKEAALALARYTEIAQSNYPKAVEYYVLAGSLGSEKALFGLYSIFSSKNGSSNRGYTNNIKLAKCFYELVSLVEKNPTLKFPDLAEKCPIPLHPIMGDGSEYPDIQFRVGGFLERLKTTGHDPVWEKEQGDAYIESLRKDQRRDQRRDQKRAAVEPIKYQTIPLDGLDQWTREQVQQGEYFVKRGSQWIYVKDGAEVPSQITGYMASILGTYYDPVIEAERFHEDNNNQFRVSLKGMLAYTEEWQAYEADQEGSSKKGYWS